MNWLATRNKDKKNLKNKCDFVPKKIYMWFCHITYCGINLRQTSFYAEKLDSEVLKIKMIWIIVNLFQTNSVYDISFRLTH